VEQTQRNTPASGPDVDGTPCPDTLQQQIHKAFGFRTGDQGPGVGDQIKPAEADCAGDMRQRLTGRPPGNGERVAGFRRAVDELFPPKRNIRGISVRYCHQKTNSFPARLRNTGIA
jgi:hypothetical protein